MVYIREAHPIDGWQVGANERDKVLFAQPKTFADRTHVAKKMCATLKINLPAIVDGIDDKVNHDYSAAPDRLYLVGADGRVAFQGERGPRGFRPGDLEAAIKKLPEVAGKTGPEKKQ
jgi:hypothetical protein